MKFAQSSLLYDMILQASPSYHTPMQSWEGLACEIYT